MKTCQPWRPLPWLVSLFLGCIRYREREGCGQRGRPLPIRWWDSSDLSESGESCVLVLLAVTARWRGWHQSIVAPVRGRSCSFYLHFGGQFCSIYRPRKVHVGLACKRAWDGFWLIAHWKKTPPGPIPLESNQSSWPMAAPRFFNFSTFKFRSVFDDTHTHFASSPTETRTLTEVNSIHSHSEHSLLLFRKAFIGWHLCFLAIKTLSSPLHFRTHHHRRWPSRKFPSSDERPSSGFRPRPTSETYTWPSEQIPSPAQIPRRWLAGNHDLRAYCRIIRPLAVKVHLSRLGVVVQGFVQGSIFNITGLEPDPIESHSGSSCPALERLQSQAAPIPHPRRGVPPVTAPALPGPRRPPCVGPFARFPSRRTHS